MTEFYIPQHFQDIANMARTRDNNESELDVPRGNCEKCGKQLRTSKDTRLIWYWLGYMGGQIVMKTAIRKHKKRVIR